MASTDFTYADANDLNKYFNRANDFDSKRQLLGNITTSTNLHTIYDVGDTQQLFVNGAEKTKVTDTPNSDGEWNYYSATDTVTYYDSGYTSTTINEQILEAGTDSATFITEALTNGSLELHNYLDRRFSTPLQKNKQIDVDSAISVDTLVAEYDPIIVKATCYISASNMIRAKEGASEEADYYHALVTNPERTGLIDKLNDGIYKLSYEYTNTSKSGVIRFSTSSSTMRLVEVTGEYLLERYDVLRVNVSTSGAYGIAEFTVTHYGNDKLYGSTTAPEKISGTLQHLYGGIYGRWSGANASDSDSYEIVCHGKGQKQTNASSGSIELTR